MQDVAGSLLFDLWTDTHTCERFTFAVPHLFHALEAGAIVYSTVLYGLIMLCVGYLSRTSLRESHQVKLKWFRRAFLRERMEVYDSTGMAHCLLSFILGEGKELDISRVNSATTNDHLEPLRRIF